MGAKMVPFAGYELPIHFQAGILGEHIHTRTKAGLFDVSHMGQVMLRGDGAAEALETLVPGDITGLPIGRIRYTQFTNDIGGILDDILVANVDDGLFIVVNAGCKKADIDRMREKLPSGIEVDVLSDVALIALQGPAAESVLSRHVPGVSSLGFMSSAMFKIAGVRVMISRAGYTGEDGFEISVDAAEAGSIARGLLVEPEVLPAGLGARDSLRLEAGFCLYGHDIDTTTSPVEAALEWSISKRRREYGGFPGAVIIQQQLRDGATRRRVGICPDGRAPAREHTELTDLEGGHIGEITSGGFGPSVGIPIAMGYVTSDHAKVGTAVNAMVRGKALSATVTKLPFVVPHKLQK
jgi:aminomethyltransferase